ATTRTKPRMHPSESAAAETGHGPGAPTHTPASTVGTVDALTALLDGPRARGAFLLRSLLAPPWSLRIRDEAALAVAAVVRGAAWYVPDDGPPLFAGPG